MERRRKPPRDQPSENTDQRGLKISIYSGQKDLSIARSSVRRLVSLVLEDKETEVAVHFVGKKKISQLHQQFFADPSPTDCISFPIGGAILGEIFVCPQVAKEYDPQNPYLECSLYVIHGLLHLLGYDDIQREDRQKMQRAQRRLLKMAKEKKCLLQPRS